VGGRGLFRGLLVLGDRFEADCVEAPEGVSSEMSNFISFYVYLIVIQLLFNCFIIIIIIYIYIYFIIFVAT